MKRLLPVMLCAALTACATTAPRTVTVDVPVPVPCHVEAVDDPVLPVDALAGDEDIFVINRALWASIEIYAGHVLKLMTANEACR